MTTVENVMILASAGSGKTYALTNRFVRLLALGAKPERIVALTFTRKAAGEFFDEILKKLAHAASDLNYAKVLASEIGVPELRSDAFLKIHRSVQTCYVRRRRKTTGGAAGLISGPTSGNLPLRTRVGLLGKWASHLAQRDQVGLKSRFHCRVAENSAKLGEYREAGGETATAVGSVFEGLERVGSRCGA